MLNRYIAALKDAIFAVDRPFVDIADQCRISRPMIYRITSINGDKTKPLRKNAEALTNYLCAELDDKLRYHIKEVKRIREIKNALAETYESLYQTKNKCCEDD